MRATMILGAMTAAAGALVLGAAHAAAQAAPASPAATVDRQKFSNTWKLNLDESEKLRDKMRQAHGGGEHGGGGGGRGGGGGFGGGGRGGGMGGRGGYGGGRRGGGGMGGGGGDPTASGNDDAMRETMRRLDEPPETLTIKQEDGAFLVGDDTGQIRHLHPDGRSAKADDGDGQVKTEWRGDALVTETIPAHGPRVRETFALSPDGRRLFVTAHFEPRWGGAVDVRRVYDVGEDALTR
jgi:hypothetical protein